MNKLLSLSAAMLIVASTTGCGCCGLLRGRTQTVAMPAVQNCAPTCAPCDPCCNDGSYYGGEMYNQPTMAPMGG